MTKPTIISQPTSLVCTSLTRNATKQVIAEISDGYYLAQFDCIEKGAPPPRLEVVSSVEFNKLCDSCGSRHRRFFANVLKVKKELDGLVEYARSGKR